MKLPDSKKRMTITIILKNSLYLCSTVDYSLSEDQVFLNKKQKSLRSLNVINKWLELQDIVNTMIDSSLAVKTTQRDTKGIRQLIQKKEGIFRMKIMGKRVNFAARSVISPDPYLTTNEIGVPIFMAKKLTFPQNVCETNSKKLRQLIINGANKYPGANYIKENGNIIKLDVLDNLQRTSIAKNLLLNSQKKTVYRHLLNGDRVLFNRQPTLHKPSLMTHLVRVIPKQQTLRMHYANCKSYNGDFDGDQMNMHVLQNYVAAAQTSLNLTDKVFVNPSNGKPIRQLIQDSVVSAVMLSSRDCFFRQEQYSQLLFGSCNHLLTQSWATIPLQKSIPAILRPIKIWTGKQLISNIIKIILQKQSKANNLKGLKMTAPIKIPKHVLYGDSKDQAQIVILADQLLAGFVDKAQIGSGTQFGLIHSYYQAYGAQFAGNLFTCLAKLFTTFLQMQGFSCGLDDLMISKQGDQQRKIMIEKLHVETMRQLAVNLGINGLAQDQIYYYNRPSYQLDQEGRQKDKNTFEYVPQQDYMTQSHPLLKQIKHRIYQNPQFKSKLDAIYKNIIHQKTSNIQKQILKKNIKQFPQNSFSTMALSGAKGSNLNHNQVSVMLGQQQLEGNRVPIMPNGATLPSFLPFSPNPRHGGFIGDRFLTGLRPQEFYFHCMAGRQGLIDTAIKTSRSGYLQRCLVKHMQNMKVEYDLSVRDADGSICQLFYGEDGIDIGQGKWLNKLDFYFENKDQLKQCFKVSNYEDIPKAKRIVQADQTTMNVYNPGTYFSSIPQKCQLLLQNYCKNKKMKPKDRKDLCQLYSAKIWRSLVHPGESVGIAAAQAIGQPSTQMTLNTFHLAGHGGVNLTLGIPRLREILTTSNDKIKTPMMQLFFKRKIGMKEAQRYCKQFQKIQLMEFVKGIEIIQTKVLKDGDKVLPYQQRYRKYVMTIYFHDLQIVNIKFGISQKQIKQALENKFIRSLNNLIAKLARKQIGFQTLIQKQTMINQFQDDEQKKDDDDIEKDNKQKKQKRIFVTEFTLDKNEAQIVLKVPFQLQKLLLSDLTQKILKNTTVRQVLNISKAMIMQKKEQFYIQTLGCNFKSILEKDYLDFCRIGTNDIKAIYNFCGVLKFQQIQAARNSIIKEILRVFSGYGVMVDYRHLYLIADYMTQNGSIRVMNRNFMQHNISPFLKMSFETSSKFLSKASMFREFEENKTVSSQITLGRAPRVGTNMFDLHMVLKYQS